VSVELSGFDHRARGKAIQGIVGLGILYLCADIALNRFAFSDGWTILWPLNGVTIALLIMRRRKEWPAILLAVGIAIGIGECIDGNSWRLEIWERLFSLLEVFLSAWLLPSFETLETWLRKRLIFYRFLAALAIGPGISGVLAALLFHFSTGQAYLLAFNNWATADALGIAATMPLVLSIRSREMRQLFDAHNIAKTIAVLVFALMVAGAIFAISRYPLLFLLFPILLLVETLLAFAGVSIAVFGISLLSVFLTIHAHGPFGQWPANLPIPRDAALQLYLGFNLVALFPASILSMERRRMSEELRTTNARLTTLASLDGLTGIANRRSLDEAFAREWKRAIRVQSPLSFLMVDLDHFKQFNDLYGHHAGDLCLKAVAEVLGGHLRRASDVAARFGGEEFALLLPHTSLKEACDLAETIRLAVVALSLHHEGSPWGTVTISMGCCSVTPSRGDDQVSMFQSADAALYLAKQAGRNCVQVGATQPAAAKQG
jgi:diguanylate cyclase (GGDEF)-like protein